MKLNARITVLGLVLASQSAAASSLPQMDPTWYPNQLLWLAVSFLVLYVAVARFIVPSIQAILTNRESAIALAIAEAETAKKAAESTRGEAESASHSARARAAEIMAKLQAETSAEATQAFSKLDHDLSRRADQAAAVLEDAVKKASAGIEAAATDLAKVLVAKLVGTTDNTSTNSEPKLKLAVKR